MPRSEEAEIMNIFENINIPSRIGIDSHSLRWGHWHGSSISEVSCSNCRRVLGLAGLKGQKRLAGMILNTHERCVSKVQSARGGYGQAALTFGSIGTIDSTPDLSVSAGRGPHAEGIYTSPDSAS